MRMAAKIPNPPFNDVCVPITAYIASPSASATRKTQRIREVSGNKQMLRSAAAKTAHESNRHGADPIVAAPRGAQRTRNGEQDDRAELKDPRYLKFSGVSQARLMTLSYPRRLRLLYARAFLSGSSPQAPWRQVVSPPHTPRPTTTLTTRPRLSCSSLDVRTLGRGQLRPTLTRLADLECVVSLDGAQVSRMLTLPPMCARSSPERPARTRQVLRKLFARHRIECQPFVEPDERRDYRFRTEGSYAASLTGRRVATDGPATARARTCRGPGRRHRRPWWRSDGRNGRRVKRLPAGRYAPQHSTFDRIAGLDALQPGALRRRTGNANHCSVRPS